MKRFYLIPLLLFFFASGRAQTVSTFMDTTNSGAAGLTIDGDFVYSVFSFSGAVCRKSATSGDNTYETFTFPGTGYEGVCKIGDFLYASKPYNGNSGIYRMNVNDPSNSELFLSMNYVFGLASRNSELYFSSENKIYKMDLELAMPAPIQIADEISGGIGFEDSVIGLRIYDGFLYFMETTGISRIDLDSGNYEKENVIYSMGNSVAKGNGQTFYVTIGNSVYQVDAGSGISSLLATIPGFIGAYDIVFKDDSLFVTAREGNYDKVARIDLNLGVDQYSNQRTVLYPNPAKDYLAISPVPLANDLAIINISGQMIQSAKIDSGKIDISNLASGIYFLRNADTFTRFIKE